MRVLLPSSTLPHVMKRSGREATECGVLDMRVDDSFLQSARSARRENISASPANSLRFVLTARWVLSGVVR